MAFLSSHEDCPLPMICGNLMLQLCSGSYSHKTALYRVDSIPMWISAIVMAGCTPNGIRMRLTTHFGHLSTQCIFRGNWPPAVASSPFVTIQDMVVSVFKQFKPSRLSSPSHLGVAFSNCPLETRYQFEFYRGLFAANNGAVRISSELLTMTGTSDGCLDFFVLQQR